MDTNNSTVFCRANIACKNLSLWFNSNKLSINASKSYYIVMKPKSNTNDIIKDLNLSIKLNNVSIVRVFSTCFLGVLFDDQLKWKAHINSLATKCICFCSIFNKQHALIPLKGRRLLYNAFINSIISYCIVIYGNTYYSNLKPVYLACNRVLRILQFANRDTNCSLLYKNFNILSVHELYKLELGILLFKVFNCNKSVPEVIVSIYAKNVYNHNYNTRDNSSTILYDSTILLFNSLNYLASLPLNTFRCFFMLFVSFYDINGIYIVVFTKTNKNFSFFLFS